MSKNGSPLEGAARRKAQSVDVVSASPFGRGGGRLSARHMRSFEVRDPRFAPLERAALSRPSSACSFGGDLANTGPRFRLDIALKARGRSRNIRSSASSWQGLVVVPGGAPVPPECPACEPDPRGAAPRPALTTPRESAPQRTRWPESNVSSQAGDKMEDCCAPHHIRVTPAKAGVQGHQARSERPWIPAFLPSPKRSRTWRQA
jgi:hypothetical protein